MKPANVVTSLCSWISCTHVIKSRLGSHDSKGSPYPFKEASDQELSLIEAKMAGYCNASQVTGSSCLNINGSQKLLSLIHLAQLDS
jgi:hypothetical protein